MLRALMPAALLAAWISLTGSTPAMQSWDLASPEPLLRVVHILRDKDPAPELGADWPSSLSLVSLEGGRQAWIWEVSRDAIPDGPRIAIHAQLFEAPLPDVICFGCSEADRAALAPVIGEPKATDQDPKDVHPLSPISLVISEARVSPNPFNPFLEDADLSVTLTENAEVTVSVYDWNGQFVATAFRGSWVTGLNQTTWSGQAQDGRKLGNGVYFLKVTVKGGSRQEEQVLKVAVWNER